MEIKSQEDVELVMIASVSIACEKLTDLELNTLYMNSILGSSPKGLMGYDKVSFLYTENGERMHEETKKAFQRVARNRLAAAWEESPVTE
jgi:hypothetical protein